LTMKADYRTEQPSVAAIKMIGVIAAVIVLVIVLGVCWCISMAREVLRRRTTGETPMSEKKLQPGEIEYTDEEEWDELNELLLAGTPYSKYNSAHGDYTMEIARCQQCNQKAKVVHFGIIYVMCTNDDCENEGPEGESEQEAIELWNEEQQEKPQ